MKIIERKGENPWAYPKRSLESFTGTAAGLYFHYFRTHDEARKSLRVFKRKTGKDYGGVQFRPGECYSLCDIIL